ncbi:MAG: c-type cytochrome [Planctomycetaceae bacterium]|nr:c-type cytochrome [Planctomycetaceae bacterium]
MDRVLKFTPLRAAIPKRRVNENIFEGSQMRQVVFSRSFHIPFAAAVAVLFSPGAIPTSAEEHARWEFAKDTAGWSGQHQVDLAAENGQLVVRSTGNDPHFLTNVKAPAGRHRLTLDAQFKGSADVQVFWTTEAAPGTTEERSVRTAFRGSPDGAKSFHIYFHTDSPLTSLRIDPFSRKGEMRIASITLTDDAPPEPQATPVAEIRVPEGFRVELLHSVRAEEHGSWVSMTTDDQGRLIVSDQYGKLQRVTVPAIGSDATPKIETINVEIGMAQGLLYAFNSLYVMVNGTDGEKQGLYRVTDTNGDDQFDHVEHLRKIDGGGEHGPHAVIAAPDGKSLYVCAGNHTLPTEFKSSRVPQNWGEDQLLPRMWDAGGHAVGKLAPGGWIAKVSPDGRDWELVASGFRNEYDIAFSPAGELFTYDADMEWDVGTPWYRPTRVNHVTSGAEFGWRSGTGKWPVWYPDSLPSVVDIGPGSPTGIAFGTGANFPEKYQRALFISDWSYGVICAVHLTPDGATWNGEAERFASAAPLPATDIVIGKDGAMYFTIGGRRTQSGLYRVTYVGTEPTTRVSSSPPPLTELHQLRRELESLHHPGAEGAVEKAWPHLGHPDRHIRFAARIAVEHQPVQQWADRALSESRNPDARITALLALARNGDAVHQERLQESLAMLADAQLTESQTLAALRVLGLCFIRMGAPDSSTAAEVAAALSPRYPSASAAVNRELCAMLVYLQDATVAKKTLPLMTDISTQEEQLHYALCLRALKQGWTTELRSQYFNWFLTATTLRGGHSFGGFLKNIRQEAIDGLSAEESAALQDVLAKNPEPAEPVVEAASRPFVKEWKVADLIDEVQAGLTGRNFDNGSRMFTITACYRCHRFSGRGGIVGPELTAVGRRYNAQSLLESVIEPSKVISDQYKANTVLTKAGKILSGRIVSETADRISILTDPEDSSKVQDINRSDIDEIADSTVSIMPKDLLKPLNQDEILDLLAYLLSRGDEKHAMFRP